MVKEKNRGQKARLFLFFLGLLIASLGWFVDKTPSYPFLMNLLLPECVAVQTGLEQLETGKIQVLNSDNPAFKVLIKWWHPNTPRKFINEATCIAKGQTMFDTGSSNSFYVLTLCQENGRRSLDSYFWPSVDVKKKLQNKIEGSLLAWSGVIFFCGLFLSAIVVVWEYLSS